MVKIDSVQRSEADEMRTAQRSISISRRKGLLGSIALPFLLQNAFSQAMASELRETILVSSRGDFAGAGLSSKGPITAVCEDGDGVIYAQSGFLIHALPMKKPRQLAKSSLSHIYEILKFENDLVVAFGGRPGEVGRVEFFSPEFESAGSVDIGDEIVTSGILLEGNEIVCGSLKGELTRIEGISPKELLAGRLPQVSKRLMNLHNRGVTSIVRLSNGLICTAGNDHVIRLVHERDFEVQREWNQHLGDVLTLKRFFWERAGMPVQELIVSASRDKTVRFWEPATGRMLRFSRFTSIPTALTWCEELRQVIVGTESGEVLRLDPQTLKLTQVAEPWLEPISVVHGLREARKLFVGGGRGRVDFIEVPKT